MKQNVIVFLAVFGLFGATSSVSQITVNCAKGQSLQQAIESAPTGEPIFIQVIGFCSETVTLESDWAYLQGVGSGAGIDFLRVVRTNYLTVDSLWLSRLSVFSSIQATVSEVTIDGPVSVEDASVRFDTVDIRADSSFALIADRASLKFTDGSIESTGIAIGSDRSSIKVENSYVEGSYSYDVHDRSEISIRNSTTVGGVKIRGSSFSLGGGIPGAQIVLDGGLQAYDDSFVYLWRVLQVSEVNAVSSSRVLIGEGSSLEPIYLRRLSRIEVTNAEVRSLHCQGSAEGYCSGSTIGSSSCGGCPASP